MDKDQLDTTNRRTDRDRMGIWMATSLVIGNMVGAGVFLLPATLAPFGAISVLGWLLSAAGALLIAKVFAGASKLLPNADGGPYAYTRRGFGDFAGFLMAWGYWISIWCTNATIAISLVSALSTFFPVLATNPVADIVTGLGAIWLLTWINTRGIQATGEVQLVTTLLKLVPLAVVAFGGLFYMRLEHFRPFNTSGLSAIQAIAASASLTLFAYMGIECATIPASKVGNPERTIPRATMLGAIITTIIYISGSLSVLGVVPPGSLKESVTPFADAAASMWGSKAHYWMAAGVAMAAFGALNGWIMIQGQVSSAIAKDRLFPAIFARENSKGMPAAGLVIGSIVVSVFMMMNYTRGLVEQFRFMLLLATLCSLVPYSLVAASYVIMMMERPGVTVREWVRVLVVSSLAFIFSVLAIIGAGKDTVYWGFVLLLSGAPFYVYVIWKGKTST